MGHVAHDAAERRQPLQVHEQAEEKAGRDEDWPLQRNGRRRLPYSSLRWSPATRAAPRSRKRRPIFEPPPQASLHYQSGPTRLPAPHPLSE